MAWRGLLICLGLLFLSLTVCAQGEALATSSGLLQSILDADEPAPIPAEPASYEDDTVELRWTDTAICPDDWSFDYDYVNGEFTFTDVVDYIQTDYFVTEFECKPKGDKQHYGEPENQFVIEPSPAGFCAITRSEDGRLDGRLPSGSTTQELDFKLDAFCMLKKNDECDMGAFQGAVLDISGIVIFDENLVIDKDPRQWPTLKCGGLLLPDAEENRRMARGNTTTPDQQRMQNRRKGLKGKGSRAAKRQARKRAPATGTGPTKATAMYGGHRHHDEGRHYSEHEAVPTPTTPKTYYRGPASIYKGVVYAHDPNGKGLIGTGSFTYVQPEFIRSDATDEDLGQVEYGWEILTSAPAGKVYTPFEYNIKMTPGSLSKAQEHPQYSSRRKV